MGKRICIGFAWGEASCWPRIVHPGHQGGTRRGTRSSRKEAISITLGFGELMTFHLGLENSIHTPASTVEVSSQWEFQDPKLEVLYHIRPYFVGIFPYIGLI